MASFSQICVHPKNHLTELAQPQDGSLALSPRSKCGACDCPILGKAFHCSACNSDLHPFCSSRPSNFTCNLHPHPLTLLTGGFVIRRCTVCDEDIRGVYYTCSSSSCKFDIHPICSQLPLVIPRGPQLQHPLHLQLGDNDNRADCDVCRRQCGKWAYRCDVPSVTLIHYSCLSEKIVLGTGGDPAAVQPADHQSRCLGPSWGFHHPYHHSGYGYNYNYGGDFSGQGYGAGTVPNYYYNNNYGGGFYGHWVPNYYNHHNNGGGGGFQNHSSNNAGGGSGGSSGGSGGLGGWIGRIGGSLAVGVLCNLIADPIQHVFFGN